MDDRPTDKPRHWPAKGELRVACPQCKKGTLTATETRPFDLWSDGEQIRLLPKFKGSILIKCDRCRGVWKEEHFGAAWKTSGKPLLR